MIDEIELPDWRMLVNERFLPFIHNQDRYNIFYGGRSSSKSRFVATKLIYRALSEEKFKCLLIRRVAESIRESQFAVIKSVVKDLGLEDFFTFTISPLQIKCKSGASFVCRGLDDPDKIRSVADIVCVWWEEEIPDEDGFAVVTSSVRGPEGTYLQEIFTLNSDIEGEFVDHWFYKRFFAQHPNEKNFREVVQVPLEDGRILEQPYTAMHSTYKDNKWNREETIAGLENYKVTDPYRYQVWTLGEWTVRQRGALFYKSFHQGLITDCKYNPDLPLHISFDFNVNPYNPALIMQLEGRTLRVIDEIAMKSPHNTNRGVCREIERRYPTTVGMFIYGDATGKSRSTRGEASENDFTIIMSELEHYRPRLRVPEQNPSVFHRGQWINLIFSEGLGGICLEISPNCKLLLQDFNEVKEDGNGGKKKEREVKQGVTQQRVGHLSDAFDYGMCSIFNHDFRNYTRGGGKHERIFGTDDLNRKHHW